MRVGNLFSLTLRSLPVCSFVLVIIFPLLGLTASAYKKLNVTVQGVEGPLLANVLAYLSLEQEKDHPNLTEGLVRKLYERSPDEIKRALQPFGYYNPTLKTDLTQEKGIWQATYIIDPGKRVTINKIDITITGPGAEDEAFIKFLNNFPLKVGDPLDHSLYEEGKRKLLAFTLGRGYLDGRTGVSEVKVYPERLEAEITLSISTGPRFFFGDVTFEQEIFDDDFLQRFVPFRKGDPYSFARLFELRSALQNSDYFSSIEMQPRRETAEGLEVPVTVLLTPRKPWAFTIGVGFGTDTGPRVSGGVRNRRINRRGHRLEFEFKVSQIESNFATRYTIPLANPRTDSLTFTAGLFNEDTDTYIADTFLVGVSKNHAAGRWQRAIFLNFQKERFRVANDSGRPKLLIPGVSWTYIDSDDPAFTTRGWRFITKLQGTEDALISGISFLQLTGQVKFIYGLWGFGRFILRGDGGTTLVNNFSEMPATLRYFAGGDRSIRGYAYKSLGPVNNEGEVTGGKHLLIGSIEYEQKLIGKFSAALFYDGGNAINDLDDPYAKGAGFGARWLSPIGQIRLDLAFALSKEGNPRRLHLVIGPDL